MNYNETSQWAADLGSGYSAIRPLGEGGMGTLYRAHKDSLDVDVVIKRVKQKFKGRMDERAEANILKTLKHKYLPRIYDVIESPSGYVYTIMDMIPGENMQNYVKTHGPVSQKLAYRWACQLCEVIAYLHSQVPPILHCDIKPSNIMITPAGDICVIDFNTSLVFSKGVLAIGASNQCGWLWHYQQENGRLWHRCDSILCNHRAAARPFAEGCSAHHEL